MSIEFVLAGLGVSWRSYKRGYIALPLYLSKTGTISSTILSSGKLLLHTIRATQRYSHWRSQRG